MPPNNHALLSPSSSHRWLNCTKSALLESEFENKESEAAAEGTAAHDLCEHKVKKSLRKRSKRPTSKYASDEMEEHTDAYRDFVLEQFELEKQTCPDAQLFLEIKLSLENYIPGSFGTCDCLIVSDNKMHIIDFKYGLGILVDATDNTQLKLYAIAALEAYGMLYSFDDIAMTIFQPRRENLSTWTISVDELQQWADKVLKPKAVQAAEGTGEFCSGEWCTFCRAAVKCRARAAAKLDLAKHEFTLPPLLSDEEIENILSLLPDLTKWANDIMAYASDAAINHGKQWNFHKVVAGRSIRKYKDETSVIEAAKDAGYTDIFKQSLIPLTEMEKLMGKSRFNEVLGDLVIKPPGKPTLVSITDKRQAIHVNNANNEFNKIKEEF